MTKRLSQQLLDALDTASVLKCHDCGTVTEIMKTGGIHADLRHQLLEMLIYRGVAQMTAHFVGKNEVMFIVPRFTGGKLPFKLFDSLSLENIHHRRSHRNGAIFAVFGLFKEDIATALPLLLKLTTDLDFTPLEVDVLPLQAEDFRLSETREQVNDVHILVRIVLDDFQKVGDAVVHQRLQFGLLLLGQLGIIRGVLMNHTGQHSLLEGTVEDAMNVLDALGGECLLLFVPLTKTVDEPLNLHGIEGGKLRFAEIQDDITLRLAPVIINRPRFEVLAIGVQPFLAKALIK